MRALFISYNGTSDPLFHTQGVAYLRDLARRGAVVHVLTYERRITPRRHARAWRRAQQEALARDGLVWHPLRYHKHPVVLSTVWDVAVGMLVAGWLVARHRLTILHARGTIPALVAAPAARLFGRRWIFDVRGLASEEYADGGLWPRDGWLHRAARRIERALLRQADAVVVLTQQGARLLTQDGRWQLRAGVRPHVIPCCVDTDRFAAAAACRASASDGSALSLVYLGSIGTWYRLEEMIRFVEMVSAIRPATFLVVSPSAHHPQIRQALQRSPAVAARTTVVAAEPEEVPRHVAGVGAGLALIVPALSKQFSSPTKIGEYLASGLPVVVNAGVGDLEGFVREHQVGVVLPDLTDAAMRQAADELVALLRDPQLSERCRRTARTYLDISRGQQRYWDVYQSLANHAKVMPCG